MLLKKRRKQITLAIDFLNLTYNHILHKKANLNKKENQEKVLYAKKRFKPFTVELPTADEDDQAVSVKISKLEDWIDCAIKFQRILYRHCDEIFFERKNIRVRFDLITEGAPQRKSINKFRAFIQRKAVDFSIEPIKKSEDANELRIFYYDEILRLLSLLSINISEQISEMLLLLNRPKKYLSSFSYAEGSGAISRPQAGSPKRSHVKKVKNKNKPIS